MPALRKTLGGVLSALCLLPVAAGARNPTEYEQYMVELINRARLDPAAEVARLSLGDLNEGPPTLGPDPYTIPAGPHQPVAVSPEIVDAAGDYATLLNDNDVFEHTFMGTTPESRMAAAGYVPMVSDFDFFQIAGYTGLYGTSTSGFVPGRENLAYTCEPFARDGMIEDLYAAVESAHNGLFTDLTVPSRGHRSTMMYGEWKEVGVGISEGQDQDFLCAGLADSLYITIDFAHRSDTGPFLTGVAYQDLDMDDFYTPDAGEALGGLDVEVFEAGTPNLVGSTTTFSSGGYGVSLPEGSYDVRFSGMGFEGTFGGIVIGQGPEGIPENTKLDFVPVPEPGSGLLSAGALGLVGLLARHRRSRSPTGRD